MREFRDSKFVGLPDLRLRGDFDNLFGNFNLLLFKSLNILLGLEFPLFVALTMETLRHDDFNLLMFSGVGVVLDLLKVFCCRLN